MRITGGTARNRKLISPKTTGRDIIRPTSDRVREALFNIIGAKVIGAHVLDLFAGTGSLGLEAISRGAARAVFVDRSPRAIDLIRRNVALCFPGMPTEQIRLDLSRKSAERNLAANLAGCEPFTLVFLDPPYERDLAEMTLTLIEKSGLLAPDASVIVEERAGVSLPGETTTLRLQQQRRYGETGIWIYRERQTITPS